MNLSTSRYSGTIVTLDLTDEIGHEVDLSDFPPPAEEHLIRVCDLGNGTSRISWLTYDDDPIMWELPWGSEPVQFDTEEELDAWLARKACDEDNEIRPGEYEDYYNPEEWTGTDESDPQFYRGRVGYIADSTIWQPHGRGNWIGLLMPDARLGHKEGFTAPDEALPHILNDYQAWCDGENYGVNSCEVDNATGEVIEDTYDAVWGFTGYEYAEQTLECMDRTGDYA